MPGFKLKSKFSPTGDQPDAIAKLVLNLNAGICNQTLLGVTGSGKTFTMANVIELVQKPTLVISHNKTLAAQLYQEFKEFFPQNAVHYFVSYYDYYQPEAYIPQTDTYIEKDAKINEMIDALRHASTASLLTRNDVIIVASVSCIYGIGNPEEYKKVAMELRVGERITQKKLISHLATLQYARNPIDPRQGHFRVRENTVEIHLPSGEDIISVEIDRGQITAISRRSQKNLQTIHPPKFSKGKIWEGKTFNLQAIRLFPAKHFVAEQEKLNIAATNIRNELKERLAELKKGGFVLEASRLKQRTEFDLEMLAKTGYVNGIENYSRHLDSRAPGSPPHTLIDYFNYAYKNYGSPTSIESRTSLTPNWLCIIDESHATIPQLRGMYQGDKSRKETLINYGFRLPSALDNRPLKFEEFNEKISQTIYLSATPAAYEINLSKESCKKPANRSPSKIFQRENFGGRDLRPTTCIVEQLIRPTGILDPQIGIRKTTGQIRDVIKEVKKRIKKKERSLVMTLTKRLAEDVAHYLADSGIKAEYLHSEIKTLERPEVLKKLRSGVHDVIVGINLLREGLDLPEVSFIAILDADKEGFLRNETTLVQIIGRAARHTRGKVILYGDTVTGSMKAAINETNRRRKIQEEYNKAHHITPQKIEKAIRESLLDQSQKEDPLPEGPAGEIIKSLAREMKNAVRELNFELAAKIRDRIKKYKGR